MTVKGLKMSDLMPAHFEIASKDKARMARHRKRARNGS